MLVYVDRSTVDRAHIAELRTGLDELVTFIEENEPQLLSYGFYFDAGETQMTVIAVHPDSASLELHVDIGRERFRALGPYLHLEAIDVYGEPSAAALSALEQKAAMLGDATVTVHALRAGFARIP